MLRLMFAAAAAMLVATVANAELPSGERQLGKTIIEPGYDDRSGADAANTHVTTEAQLEAAIDAGDAIMIPTDVIFHCNLVSASVYNRATPVPPAP